MTEIPLTLDTATAWLSDVLGQFPDERIKLERTEVLEGDKLQGVYKELLVHAHHMTVTLEKKYGTAVFLEVLNVLHEGDSYARKLILRAGRDGPVVLAGIMRFRLEFVSEKVRSEIVEAHTPLGRILIENEILRKIETIAFLRFPLENSFGELLGSCAEEDFTYGRIAIIYCDGAPAVELLELIPPENQQPAGDDGN